MIVLVGYASAHGSTHEIAQRIATLLKQDGVDAETAAMDAVRDPQRYDAFVLGSAVHNGHWLPPATAFLREHGRHLDGRPVWLYSVGLTRVVAGRHAGSAHESEQVAAFREIADVREHHVFSGVLAKDDLPWFGRRLFRMVRGHYGDYRDWPEIDAWADRIARALSADHAPAGDPDAPRQS
ncbi:flavodoxin domain-containing protein [Embleya sp. NBC_00896]|uniref:flavodoxin domain-containing protein n=1 Tax=Embleya sp. NBC_00896 TaxID=2975961 RepID=UPI002F9143C4|nr:flavodoxin domain-containing protein [Embleya sp. NBC_00896]